MAFGVISVSAKSLKHVLTKKGPGWSALVVVGGADEALLAYPGTNDIVLERRKGFVKLAIQTGASLVPIFTFGWFSCLSLLSSRINIFLGENDIWYQLNDESAPKFRAWQKKIGRIMTFTLPIIWGQLLIFPRRVKLVSVGGSPRYVYLPTILMIPS